jgi:hypothetical protein
MAPSSITEEDEFKLGMYAGVDFQPGEVIGAPEIGIPLIHMLMHNGKEDDPDFLSEQADFMWNRETVHANFEVFHDDDVANMDVFIPGIGSLGNQHHTSYVNSAFDFEALFNRTMITEITSNDGVSPALGANSQYYGITMKSARHVSVGAELFMGGLEVDEEEEEETSMLSQEDFDSVDGVLTKVLDLLNKHKDSINDTKKELIYEYIYDVFETSTRQNLTEEKKVGRDEVMKLLMDLFPESVSDIEHVLHQGGSFTFKFPESVRSIEWLKENGQCMDGLYLGKSTIPEAEKGAFTKRAVKKGELVSPAPLLLIPDVDYLSMYETEIEGKSIRIKEPKGEPISKQLIMNYCLGHPQSSLLLCPYGMGMNMINHKPTNLGANAKIVWSKSTFYDSGILDLTLDQIVELYAPNLPVGIDIIATADIASDEEIFIDYGNDWQNAWDEHVKGWDSSQTLPKDAMQMNAERSSKPFLSLPERLTAEKGGESDILPQDITTACYAVGNLIEDQKNTSRKEGLESLTYDADETEMSGQHFRMCEIIGRLKKQDSSYRYTVKMLQYDDMDDVIMRNVPHANIKYVDKPYTSSMHKYAFRHPIIIPDEMFPTSWRNVNVGA